MKRNSFEENHNDIPEKKQKKYRLYNFFAPSSNKKGKGVTKEEAAFDGKYNLSNFLKFLKNHIGDVTILNLIFILCNFSIVLMLFSLSGTTNEVISTPSSPNYQLLYGAMQYNNTSPELVTMVSAYGTSTSLSVWTIATKILVYSGFTLLLTFGISNLGMAYVTRGIVRREYVTVWGDFWHSVRKNWKQGIIMGIIDVLVIFFVTYALMFYSANRVTFTMHMLFFVAIFFAFIYFVMRMYFYILIITFDLPLKKVIKNSFLFSLLGLKRNISAILGIALVALINYFLYMFLPTVGAIIPLMFTIALMYFIGTYCAYPIIDKYMIAPYYKKDTNGELKQIKPIFTDRG